MAVDQRLAGPPGGRRPQAQQRIAIGGGKRPVVGIVGGSRSDFPVLERAKTLLDELGVPCELRVVSAHRTPDLLFRYAETAAGRGIRVVVAGAGGAAHLAGVVAAHTRLMRYGGDCYAYCLLAMGLIDVVIESSLKAWDVQALIPIVEGAGGTLTSWDGGRCDEGGDVVACGDPALAPEVRALLAGR